ncbi:MAG: hypothetical protein J7604_25030 [Sporocytophaga sp.]|uniref:hypothetical protein n=1 Tax=Sporocytophaga sp. TaxID=2231183 RepID=UPI001AFCF21B|nr:hypothetical protein [Sporocytophaga sp.]MBO9703496.1 hypothetical protein [Sporocytophaga sp.]
MDNLGFSIVPDPMSHKLNDITLYYHSNEEIGNREIARKFVGRQNVVSDLYVQFLNKYKPKGTSRISVQLEDEEDAVIGYFGSILMVKAKFEKNDYLKKNEYEQNKLILDTVHRIAILCADVYNWERKVFEDAYLKVLQCNFEYRIEYTRKYSKDKKHLGAISIEKTEEFAAIYVNFYNNYSDPIGKVMILKTFQNEMFYGGIIRKYKWFNNREFGLYTTNEELTIRASLDSSTPQIIIEPKLSRKDQIEGFLRSITY